MSGSTKLKPSTVFIHPGLHKTGTTTIQRMLAHHHAELRSVGVSVWQISENHSIPLRLWLEQGLSSRQRRRRAFGSVEEIKASLRRALANSGPSFVITGEGLSNQPVPALTTFAQFLAEESGGAELTVVVYVRRLDRHLSSYVQQKLKHGSTLSNALTEVKLLRYRERIGNLFNVFGRSRVDVRFCPEADEVGPEALLADFLQAIDARTVIGSGLEPCLNTSLSERAVRLLDLINGAAEQADRGGRRRWFVDDLRELLPGPGYRVQPEVLREVVDRHADDIDWLKDATGHDVKGFRPEVPSPSVEIDRDLAMVVFRLLERISKATADADYRAATDNLAAGDDAAAGFRFEEALLALPGHEPSRAALARLRANSDGGSK